ncbi:MAG: T9SS type A sorting domain-containing protein [Sporocytophaga sp.]|uniref:T9SS type A sorting domain-containing protein n=1 Tax=Sporocytophaga sp. TaxID=2231183 RepID=UPI001B038D91|nr:T9SS type A sorting domain-containing protein [Sporocytophaga sp.]MBO9703750.1 T9SS type A sorting domain-containing protein [Sporocytophaga sp.]
MKNTCSFPKKIFTATLLLFLNQLFAFGQSFTSSTLQNAGVITPTSLQFGPDGKLYVAQQDGNIKVLTINKTSANNYTVTGSETITLVKDIPNHNDDGSLLSQPSTKRLVTGLTVSGTSDNPILYVVSSDPRIGGASNGDINLCTNSGVLSKLTKTGNTWTKIDLVRGLSRSEETHATNGIYLYEGNGKKIMLIAVGGQTNAGSPSNVFAYICEYALSAAILSIDLNVVESLPDKQDPTGKHPYKYDIPTLDDPTRPNNPDGSDQNDPWGGNDGLNQAKIVLNGPVQVFASGFRNPYDILVLKHPSKAGKIFSIDNGPNKNWGGNPTLENGNATNKYTSSEPGSQDVGNYDGLEFIGDMNTYVTGAFYGGHPNPIRANPSGAGLYTNSPSASGWRNDNSNASLPLPSDWPPVPVADPRQSEYRKAGTDADKALLYFDNSTDGICEYRYSGNALYGDILAAGFDGNLYRIKLNATGDAVLNSKDATRLNLDKPLGSALEGKALDVTSQGDGEIFEGTIWVAIYSANIIKVFEPATVICNNTVPTADDDNDGFSNAEENDNQTDPCNAADAPSDNDSDKISDKWDNDDDNDGILDNQDFFALDNQNGLQNNIPKIFNLTNADPGTGFFGVGLTGLMSNGSTDYSALYNSNNIIAGGAIGALTVEEIPDGDAFQGNNNQQYAFQVGINTSKNTGIFTVKTGILPNYFSSGTPEDFQSHGMFIGTGDQDNYIKLSLNANGGSGGIELLTETDGVTTSVENPLPGAIPRTNIVFYLTIDPSSGIIYPKYKIDNVMYSFDPIQVSGKIASAIQNEETALAVGLIATSRGSSKRFSATWDYIEANPGDITSINFWHNGTKSKNINIYPNPSSDFVHLNINEESPQNYTLKIFNNLCQQVEERTINFNPGSDDYGIKMGDYPNGIYYFQLISEGQKNSATIKFIKK